MSRREDKPEAPGQSNKQAGKQPDRAKAGQTLHVFSPTDVPARRVAGPAAVGSSGSEVVAGFAGHAECAARERCTLYLSPEINAQLDLAAHIERKERSQVVEALLRQHLPKYRVERA